MNKVYRLLLIGSLLAVSLEAFPADATNEPLHQRLKSIEESLGFMESKLARGLNALMWWRQLEDIAVIDRVRYTGPPLGNTNAPHPHGVSNEIIIAAYTFLPRKFPSRRKLPLLVLVHGEIHGNVATDEEVHIVRELIEQGYAVIAPDYPIDHAVQRVLVGKLLNAGQTCIAPDYALVPRAQVSAFVDSAMRQAQDMYPAGLNDADYCSIVNMRQYERLAGYIEQARRAGADIVPLFSGAEHDDATHRLAPVILINPSPDLDVMREEIFGPLLSVIPYDDVKDALAFINAQPRPLAMYWFDNDGKRAELALKNTHAGGVCFNETLLHVTQEDLPFGGVGLSGMGHYHGRWGFDTFSKLTPVFRQSRLNATKLFLPPYKPHVARLLRLMKRF